MNSQYGRKQNLKGISLIQKLLFKIKLHEFSYKILYYLFVWCRAPWTLFFIRWKIFLIHQNPQSRCSHRNTKKIFLNPLNAGKVREKKGEKKFPRINQKTILDAMTIIRVRVDCRSWSDYWVRKFYMKNYTQTCG